jgi:hypothetical protein
MLKLWSRLLSGNIQKLPLGDNLYLAKVDQFLACAIWFNFDLIALFSAIWFRFKHYCVSLCGLVAFQQLLQSV